MINPNTKVVPIDHGWANMKTEQEVFTSGVSEITTEPALFNDVLEYNNKYYKIGGKRLEVNECAGYAWDDMMQLATDVLTKNSSSGTYEGVWESISTIYTTLNAVAVSLLCVFFLYGFCRDSCDLHTDLTFDRTIKMFNRLIITSNVMSMALTYMPKFFSWGKKLTKAILGENKLSMVYDFDGAKVYEKQLIRM